MMATMVSEIQVSVSTTLALLFACAYPSMPGMLSRIPRAPPPRRHDHYHDPHGVVDAASLVDAAIGIEVFGRASHTSIGSEFIKEIPIASNVSVGSKTIARLRADAVQRLNDTRRWTRPVRKPLGDVV